MRIEQIKGVYFIGAGGIGMSALIRYFLLCGKKVAGYDRTPTPLTERLISEGAELHFVDDVTQIPDTFLVKEHTLVIYTPAIPASHSELNYFMNHGFEIVKRAQVLGLTTNAQKGLCVAGTHGKTTTSTLTAHLFRQSHLDCTAFLGGVSKNYGTNFLYSDKSEYVVIEADEFDRSFHQLIPYMSVVTSADPDHLDIYGTEEAYLESFRHYVSLIRPDGCLILRKGLPLADAVQEGVTVYEYSQDEGHFHAENIRVGGGKIVFDFVAPDVRINDVNLGVPLRINIENGVAAMALAWLNGATADELKQGMANFRGIDRRFDIRVNTDQFVLLSDYAHHPEEIKQSALSITELFSGRRVTAIFQPHLYTRTRDFYREFAKSLSLFDEVIVLDIYPARELPLPGVSSRLIYDHLAEGVEKTLCTKEELLNLLKGKQPDVLAILGAGDVDSYIPEIEKLFVNNPI